MSRPLKRGILGASTIILSKDIDKYVFMCASNFNETDVIFPFNNLCFIFLGENARYIHESCPINDG